MPDTGERAIAALRLTPGAGTALGLPDPPFLHLLYPKWLTARARAASGGEGRAWRYVVLALVCLIAWAFVFGILYRILTYFKGTEEIGLLLANKVLSMILVGFFSVLILSNIITALSSFFLAK